MPACSTRRWMPPATNHQQRTRAEQSDAIASACCDFPKWQSLLWGQQCHPHQKRQQQQQQNNNKTTTTKNNKINAKGGGDSQGRTTACRARTRNRTGQSHGWRALCCTCPWRRRGPQSQRCCNPAHRQRTTIHATAVLHCPRKPVVTPCASKSKMLQSCGAEWRERHGLGVLFFAASQFTALTA